MYKYCLLIIVFVIASCSKESPIIEKRDKISVAIDESFNFNKSYLATIYYSKFGYKTIWENEEDRQDLIDFILYDINKEGFSEMSYLIKDLCLAHINYEELTYAEHIQADFDFTHTFLKVIHNLEFGRVNPKKFYSDWETSVDRFVDVDHLHRAIDENNIKEYLEKKIPSNNFYKDLKKEFNALNDLESIKAQKVMVNMERSRWLPNDMGTYFVWVNIPEERLRVFESGVETQTHKVIVGKPERKTPILSSVFNQLVINPTWTVPPTILKNDLVPKATSNRGYFASQRMKIVNKKTGKNVDPNDWDPSSYNSYRYVQSTGNSNALGLIKFNFPNDHMVYLHDTNNRSMFSQTSRALSSGCVRVDNPFLLAEKILSIEGNSTTRAELDTLVKREKTKTIGLKKIVHVHQTYLTAYVENGELKMFNDVYDLDAGLYKRLKKLK